MLTRQHPGGSASCFSCSTLCSRIHCAHSSSSTPGVACCGELMYNIVRNIQMCSLEKTSMVSIYRRGSRELQQRHIMCVSELMRLSAPVCARVTEQNSGSRMMEHLAVLMGQLLAAGCTAGSRTTLIPLLLEQARKLRPSVVHQAVDWEFRTQLLTPRAALCRRYQISISAGRCVHSRLCWQPSDCRAGTRLAWRRRL